jgi:hypothetical protein
MLEQELDLPFETTVLGMTVSVKRVDITDTNDIVAVCHRGRERQAIPTTTSSSPVVRMVSVVSPRRSIASSTSWASIAV